MIDGARAMLLREGRDSLGIEQPALTRPRAEHELFDHGRPTKVELAVLVDRGGRRLPMAADYVGFDLFTPNSEKVVVALDPKTAKRDLIRIEPADIAAREAAT